MLQDSHRVPSPGRISVRLLPGSRWDHFCRWWALYPSISYYIKTSKQINKQKHLTTAERQLDSSCKSTGHQGQFRLRWLSEETNDQTVTSYLAATAADDWKCRSCWRLTQLIATFLPCPGEGSAALSKLVLSRCLGFCRSSETCMCEVFSISLWVTPIATPSDD